jgi:hypothetical protein
MSKRARFTRLRRESQEPAPEDERRESFELARENLMTEFTVGSVLVAGLLLTACAPPRPPQRQWSSALGGASVDDCDDIVVDGAKFLFLACHSDSNDFPSSQRIGAEVNGGMDAYVVKVDASAGRIVWTARMGGGNYDGAFRIHSDGAGGVWVVGYTESRDFPASATAVQKQFGGGEGDGFVARVDANGDLTYSSYMGGTGSDQLIDLVSDRQNGSLHVIGMTSSADLPRARNSNLGREEAFLASFDPTRPDGLRIQYLGGTNDDKPTALALQPDGELVVAGYTLSSDFPIRAALQSELKGSSSAFIARFDARSGELRSSTFFGGSGDDSALGMALGQSGDIHIVGFTDSTDFPTTQRAFQVRLAGGADVFVTSFDRSVNRVRYSSYFGGSRNDIAGIDGKNIAIDSQGRTWFIGMTESRDLPLQYAHQPRFGGGDRDGFIAVVSTTGASLAYASYHGGAERDLLEGLFLTRDSVYATGLSFGDMPLHGPQLARGGAANAMIVSFRY